MMNQPYNCGRLRLVGMGDLGYNYSIICSDGEMRSKEGKSFYRMEGED